jgi:hypothetical protein
MHHQLDLVVLHMPGVDTLEFVSGNMMGNRVKEIHVTGGILCAGIIQQMRIIFLVKGTIYRLPRPQGFTNGVPYGIGLRYFTKA